MDDAAARVILREAGEDPPKRGKLGEDWHIRAAELAEGATADGDYDGGVSEADFAAEDVTVAGEPPAAVPTVVPAESRPRRPRATRPPRSLRDRLAGAKGKAEGKAKRKIPRVPVDHLISEVWAVLGGAAQRIDVPVGRCLQLQAPVAGLIMEDIVRGTAADRALQPLARAEDKAKAVAALVMPPVLVAAIEHAQTLPDEQRKTREALLWPLLVQSMVLWDRVAGDKVEEMMARATAEAPSRERAEALAHAIFSGLGPVQAEAERETVGV